MEFIDYSHVEYNPETAPAFAAVGWLPVDLAMLRNWAFLDADRFNTPHPASHRRGVAAILLAAGETPIAPVGPTGG